MKSGFYKNKKIFIAGGAGFIGPHLLSELLDQGAIVTVGDNLSIGNMKNIENVWDLHGLKKTRRNFINVDFQDHKETEVAIKGHAIVLHLAATHGGRGFIDAHPADCCENFAINQNIIRACHLMKVERVQFASSACVYPVDLQGKYSSTYLLKEVDAFKNQWGNADREYGWSKLMGEVILRGYHTQYGLKGVITRYVTVYGPGENNTHAIPALIERALNKEDPYVIWGSGKQDRDFTYVDDIVRGTLMATENISNCSEINLGTGHRYAIDDVVNMIFKTIGWRPKKVIHNLKMPEGVKTRALDISKAKTVLNWEPQFYLQRGLEKTILNHLRNKIYG